MSDLTNTSVSQTLNKVLKTASDMSGTLSAVETIDGEATPLQLSTGAVNVNSGFQIGGYTFARSGSHSLTLTTTGSTNVTFPTSGTLITSSVSSLSSLATVGTITSGTWQGTVVGSTYGGTGVNNGSSTITIGGSVTFSGAYTFGATLTGDTTVTFPTSGTLITSSVTSLSSLDTVGTITSGTWSGTTIATTKGGTGLTSYTTGDVLYASASNTLSKLAGNTTTTKKYLEQYGDGVGVTSTSWTSLKTFIQRVGGTFSTYTSGTTTTPFDNSIPQNTEGVQVITQAITPTNSSNKLKIRAEICAGTTANQELTCALFQDSTADALAATATYCTSGQNVVCVLTYEMTAGTTSATTFKIRVGGNNAGTTYFNGNGSVGQIYGGVCSSLFTIEEISV